MLTSDRMLAYYVEYLNIRTALTIFRRRINNGYSLLYYAAKTFMLVIAHLLKRMSCSDIMLDIC